MSTPNRHQILLNLQTVLATINGTGGYNTTLAGVDLFERDPWTVGKDLLPRAWVLLDDEPQQFEHLPGRQIFATLSATVVMVTAYTVTQGDPTASAVTRSQAIARMEDDLIACLMTNVTRGTTGSFPNAIVTKLSQSQANYAEDALDGRAILGMTFTVKYQRDFALTT